LAVLSVTTSARYLVTFCAVMAISASLAASLAVFADPYLRFGTPPIAGLNEEKPAAYEHGTMAKTYALERARPRTLILGNSRAEIGFDPESMEWPARFRPVFNAAAAGQGLPYSLAMLQHAIATHGALTIVLALDFRDFLGNPGEFNDDRLRVKADGAPNTLDARQRLLDALAATLTIDALSASLRTVLHADPVGGVTMTNLGFNPLRNYHAHVRSSGHHALFEQNLRQAMALFERTGVRDEDFDDQHRSIVLLDSIVAAASAKGAPVKMFVHPVHARYLEMICEAGLWPSLESWKRALARLAARYRKNGFEVELVDFSGYDSVATEPVPPPRDTTAQMRWWWEAAHYKSELGERIIRRLFGQDRSWGVALEPSTIDEHLAHQLGERTRYRQHPSG
jgi:hypothetical protein